MRGNASPRLDLIPLHTWQNINMHIIVQGLLALVPFTNAVLGASVGHKRVRQAGDDLGSWKSTSSIPIAPRQEHVTVAINSTTIAIVGGIIPDTSQTNGTISNSTGFATTNLVQLYDIPSDTWTTAAPAPVEINHANAGAVDGKIYLLGGLVFSPEGQSDQGSWIATGESWAYDPAADEWTGLEAMPDDLARGAAVVGVFESRIYLAGGLRLLDLLPITGTQDTVANVTAFDTVSGRWVTDLPDAAQELPEGRDHAVGAVVGSRFHVIGGRDRGQTNVRDTVFILDLQDLASGWQTSSSVMPTARGGLSAGTIGSKVYTFGGEGNQAVSTGVFNETEVLDTETGTWRELVPMEVPRHGTSAAAVGGRIYIPGGGIIQGATPVNIVDAYVPENV